MVVDAPNWAIDYLAKVKIKYNPQFNFKLIYCHPRDIQDDSIETQEKIKWFEDEVVSFNPDIIHFEYFRTAAILMHKLPFLVNYKTILTHHNQKQKVLKMEDWTMLGISHIVTHTDKAKNFLIDKCGQPKQRVTQIRHGINLKEFEYNDIEPKIPKVGYVGRVVPWKGLKEIARACKELGYQILFMGKQDKPEYWNEIVNEGLYDVFDFSYYDCSNEDRIKAYHEMTCYVGNSEDWYEEGTLPYLEAMASGVPVITTPNGVAAEITKHNDNGLVVNFGDYEGLKNAIGKMMTDSELRQKCRKNAWDSVKNMPEQLMAYEYQKLYYKVLNEDKILVSIIIPIKDRVEQLEKILNSLKLQIYKNFEVVVCDDCSNPYITEGEQPIISWKDERILHTVISHSVEELRTKFNFPIKYINTHHIGYGLAKARNMGVIEACGELLLFCDSRLKPDETSIKRFVDEYKKEKELKKWYFGNKGTGKASFVENFSAVNRDKFINFGMFNEEIDKYGGMSQEVRTRWIAQGGEFEYLDDAYAEQILKASKNNTRRQDIVDMKFKLYKMYGNKRY